MVRCGCGSTTACTCVLRGGTGVAITGSGSAASPYVVTATDGGVCPAPTTIAALTALRDAGGLDVCATYTVTDWVSGTGSLPGPNLLLVRATAPNQLSPTVLVYTPLGALGPSAGTFLWSFGLMTSLSDGLGNEVFDFGTGTIDAFPWGSLAWTGNHLNDVNFTGGYPVTAAALAAGVAFIGNRGVSGSIIDLTGAIAGSSISFCTLEVGASIQPGGAGFNLARCYFGTSTTVINTSTNFLQLDDCRFYGGTYAVSNDAGLTIEESNFLGQLTSVSASGEHQLIIRRSTIEDGAITDTVTGAAGAEGVTDCQIHNSALVFSGVDTGRSIIRTRVTGESAIIVVASATSSTLAVENTEVGAHSTLNVAAAGIYQDGRLGANATVNTGAFAHITTVVEGSFAVTLTAPNTNRLKNKGFSDVI